MKKLLPLMQREWLQSRFSWALMAGIPLVLALLMIGFGQLGGMRESLDIDNAAAGVADASPPVAAMLAMAAIAGTTAVMFAIAWLSSLIIVAGIARRDHADRSIEFWMSMPATHAESLAAPLIVHLLLVPAAALFVGVAGGWVISALLVGRIAGLGAWFSLPWIDIVMGSVSVVGRLLAGLPLATLWLAPLIMLVVLTGAYFRRWSWPILGVVFGVVAPVLAKVFAQPWLNEVTWGLIGHAGQAMVSGQKSMVVDSPDKGIEALRALPGWALQDFGYALRDLGSPLLFGGLLFAAGCFYLLLIWRQRGAGIAGG